MSVGIARGSGVRGVDGVEIMAMTAVVIRLWPFHVFFHFVASFPPLRNRRAANQSDKGNLCDECVCVCLICARMCGVGVWVSVCFQTTTFDFSRFPRSCTPLPQRIYTNSANAAADAATTDMSSNSKGTCEIFGI